jgi:hypothetical protein
MFSDSRCLVMTSVNYLKGSFHSAHSFDFVSKDKNAKPSIFQCYDSRVEGGVKTVYLFGAQLFLVKSDGLDLTNFGILVS